MITSGFNHADSGTNFNEIFNANDKPLIYHFENGETIVMNKGNDGYYAKIGNVNYFYGVDGIVETEEKSGLVEFEKINIDDITLEFTITDDFINMLSEDPNTSLTFEYSDYNLYSELAKIRAGKIYSVNIDNLSINIDGFADLENYQVSFMDSGVYGDIYHETFLLPFEINEYTYELVLIKSFPLRMFDTHGIVYFITCDLVFTISNINGNVISRIKNITFPYGTITSR